MGPAHRHVSLRARVVPDDVPATSRRGAAPTAAAPRAGRRSTSARGVAPSAAQAVRESRTRTGVADGEPRGHVSAASVCVRAGSAVVPTARRARAPAARRRLQRRRRHRRRGGDAGARGGARRAHALQPTAHRPRPASRAALRLVCGVRVGRCLSRRGLRRACCARHLCRARRAELRRRVRRRHVRSVAQWTQGAALGCRLRTLAPSAPPAPHPLAPSRRYYSRPPRCSRGGGW